MTLNLQKDFDGVQVILTLTTYGKEKNIYI